MGAGSLIGIEFLQVSFTLCVMFPVLFDILVSSTIVTVANVYQVMFVHWKQTVE